LKQLCLLSQAERRRKLGLPAEDPASPKPSTPVVEEKKVFIYSKTLFICPIWTYLVQLKLFVCIFGRARFCLSDQLQRQSG